MRPSRSGNTTAGELHCIRERLAGRDLKDPTAFLKETQGMPPSMSRALLEHHEVSDGTGYLSGKCGDELSAAGKIIGVVDAMCAVLLKLNADGRGPRDLIPILRINGYVHDRDVCAALIQLLTEHKWPERGLIDDAQMPGFAEALLADRETMRAHADCAQEALAAIPAESDVHKSVKAARLVHRHLNGIVQSSGVLDAGYVEWLRSVVRDRQREYYREVEDTRLMLDEVRWQLLKLTRLLGEIEQDHDAVTAAQRDLFIDKLKRLPDLPQSR